MTNNKNLKNEHGHQNQDQNKQAQNKQANTKQGAAKENHGKFDQGKHEKNASNYGKSSQEHKGEFGSEETNNKNKY